MSGFKSSNEEHIQNHINSTSSKIVKLIQVDEKTKENKNVQETVQIFQNTSMISNVAFPLSVQPLVSEFVRNLDRCEEVVRQWEDSILSIPKYKRIIFEKLCCTLSTQQHELQMKMPRTLTKDYSAEISDISASQFWASFAKYKPFADWTDFITTFSSKFPIEFKNKDNVDFLNVCLDPMKVGSASVHRFNDFVKTFGPFEFVMQNVQQISMLNCFCGYISSKEAKHILYNKPKGSFIIRYSVSTPGRLSIDCQSSKVEHYLVKENSNENRFDALARYLKSKDFSNPINCRFSLQSWYFGELSHTEADEILSGKEAGTFLIYISTIPGNFSVAIKEKRESLSHVEIQPNKDGFQIDLPNEYSTYKTIDLLVSSMISKGIFKNPATITLNQTKPEKIYKLSDSDEGGSNESVKRSNRKSLGLPSNSIPSEKPKRSSLHLSHVESDSNSDKDAKRSVEYSKIVTPADFVEVYKPRPRRQTVGGLDDAPSNKLSISASLDSVKNENKEHEKKKKWNLFGSLRKKTAKNEVIAEDSKKDDSLTDERIFNERSRSSSIDSQNIPNAIKGLVNSSIDHNKSQSSYASTESGGSDSPLEKPYDVSPFSNQELQAESIKDYDAFPQSLGEAVSLVIGDKSRVFGGICIADSNGDSKVFLPEEMKWSSYTILYQLTCLNSFSPIFVSKEIEGKSFQISGGIAGKRICWQVTIIPK